MNSNEFVNWLKGFVDACGDDLSVEQTNKVKEKLNDVTLVRCLERVQPQLPPNLPYPWQPDTGSPPNIWCSDNTGGINFGDFSSTT